MGTHTHTELIIWLTEEFKTFIVTIKKKNIKIISGSRNVLKSSYQDKTKNDFKIIL